MSKRPAIALALALLVLAAVRAPHAEPAPDDDCGLDAQELLLRFEAAREEVRGATLAVDPARAAVRGEVNVGLEPGVDAAALAAKHGLRLVRAVPGLATFEGEGSLAAEPGVRFVEPNYVARTAGDGSDPFQPLQRGWTNAHLEAAWARSTGEGVLVAVLDTGCDLDHPALAGRVVAGWDFVNGRAKPEDDNGHGTAVAGIIASRRDDGFGIAGVAPDARLLVIKVADGQGVASVANVVAGLDLALTRGARVVNLSLGTRVASRALAEAVERALAAGVVVVAAAGNDPTHQAVFPASLPGVLSVTSLGDGDELALAGSLAVDVALGAPGERIVTTYPGGVHGFIHGTSAAAAFASGVAALVLARNPGADVAHVLRAAQAPLPALAGLERHHRFGRLDALAAVDGTSLVAPYRPRAALAGVDLQIVERSLAPLTPGVATLPFTVTVESAGTATAVGAVLELRCDGTLLATRDLPPLPPGARTSVDFALPTDRADVQLVATARAPGEVTPEDATTRFDAVLDPSASLGLLYQQSNDVDLIFDAPWRIGPGKDHVPVLLFAASKGGLGLSSTRLRLDRVTMTVRDAPTAAGAATSSVVYDHVRGQPLVHPPGLVVVDELGQPRADLEPFAGAELADNGRHDIFRLPRAAFGVASTPAPGTHRFLEVEAGWTFRLPLFYGLAVTRTGSHRSVLRVGFAAEPWPRLPGEGHHHDVHTHTIAEWYFSSPLNVFAARKAYGGPLQMLRESAWAMGVTDSITDVRDQLITTDHHNFNNMTTPDPISADHWPPHGEQGMSNHAPGTTKLEAYRRSFGDAAGEEVAFKQEVTTNVAVPGLAAPLPVTLPLGAHLLLMEADHVEGPWNGGGWIAGPGNVGPDVDLFATLDGAGLRGGRSRAAYAYAAHPFGGQGWNDPNVERALGLTPAHRTREGTDRSRQQFVLKGLQLWNGRATRTLARSLVDFHDLNPWADPAFAAGSSGWDRGLQRSLTRWHEVLATDLDYAFTDAPEVRFVRKVFCAAGSDAHGDFNFGVSRMATPVSSNLTYHCANDPWYAPTTYCLAEGRPGATPAQRALQAYADGATVMSDGPLVTFTLDAETHLDGRDLRWHAGGTAHEDDDGRIGGGGAYDGLGTALVRRGSPDVTYRYRYTGSADFGSNGGQVVAVKLYKTEQGAPNPTRARGSTPQLVGRRDLPTTAPDQDLVAPLDPSAEGSITRTSALALGAFTGVDPDQGDLGPDEHRAYTNPVFVVPFDAAATVARIDSATGAIPPGGLEVELTFDVTLSPQARVWLAPLDASGASAGRSALTPLTATWADRPGVATSVLRATNPDPVRLDGPAWPRPDRCGFVVVVEDPRDAFGNGLNPIAFSFDAERRSFTGSTAPPAVAGSTPPAPPAGGSSGSGCAMAPPGGRPGGLTWPACLLLLLTLVRRRRE